MTNGYKSVGWAAHEIDPKIYESVSPVELFAAWTLIHRLWFERRWPAVNEIAKMLDPELTQKPRWRYEPLGQKALAVERILFDKGLIMRSAHGSLSTTVSTDTAQQTLLGKSNDE